MRTSIYSGNSFVIIISVAVIISLILFFMSKRPMTQKIVISIIPIVISLCFVKLILLAKENSENSSDIPSTNQNYESTQAETPIPTEPETIPIGMWGFDNSYEWYNTLVEVKPTTDGSLFFTDSEGDYVIVKEGTGHWELYPSYGQIMMGSFYTDFIPKRVSAYTYTVLDNDTISIFGNGDSGVLKITDRIEEKNYVIFEILNGSSNEYYIPYKFIGTSKKPVFFQEGNYYDYYKLYLN